MSVDLQRFIDLLREFLDERITVNQFVDAYVQLFRMSMSTSDGDTRSVVEAYLDKKISLEALRAEFRRLVPDLMDEALFHILEVLYEDVDAYSPDWTPDDFARAPYLLDESALRKRVAVALRRLDDYRSAHNGQ